MPLYWHHASWGSCLRVGSFLAALVKSFLKALPLRRSRKPIVIASRKSKLARIQAQRVGNVLGRLLPGIEIKHHWVESEGDQISQGSLAAVGGKGLFTSAVDAAVVAGLADVSVHSLKDLPVNKAEAVPGMALAAITKRADAHDCLISRDRYARLQDLPSNAWVGTSSPRRAAQLQRLRPDLQVAILRGNVDTRLSKILSATPDETSGRPFDATLLAAAGLNRMGLSEHADRPLPFDDMLPAAGQGALALCCRATDHVALQRCLQLNSAQTSTAVHAEREVVTRLGGGCFSPIAVLAQQLPPSETQAKRNADSHWFRLRVRVLSADGQTCLDADEKCKTADLRRLVKKVSLDLLKRGAAELLADAATASIPKPPQTSSSSDSLDTPNSAATPKQAIHN